VTHYSRYTRDVLKTGLGHGAQRVNCKIAIIVFMLRQKSYENDHILLTQPDYFWQKQSIGKQTSIYALFLSALLHHRRSVRADSGSPHHNLSVAEVSLCASNQCFSTFSFSTCCPFLVKNFCGGPLYCDS